MNLDHCIKTSLKILCAGLLLLSSVLFAQDLEPKSIAPQDAFQQETAFSLGLSNSTYYPHTRLVNNQIYYTPNTKSRISAKDLDGNLVLDVTLGATTLEFAIGPDGSIYSVERVANSSPWTYQIVKYNEAGDELLRFGPDGTAASSFPFDYIDNPQIEVSPLTGRLYFAGIRTLHPIDIFVNRDDINGLIHVFEADGTFVKMINTNGILADSLEGSFEFFQLGTTDDGTEEILVLNQGSTRIKVFKIDGTFDRIFQMTFATGHPYYYAYDVYNIREIMGRLFVQFQGGAGSNRSPQKNLYIYETSPGSVQNPIGLLRINVSGIASLLGTLEDGRLVMKKDQFILFITPSYRTLDPLERNAVPDPFVSSVVQRDGTTLLDIRYKVEDADDANVDTAMVALTGGTTSLLNVVPMTTFPESTTGKLGDNVPTGQVHTVAWDAGVDWNVDFGQVSVLVLARDSRTYWFDTHFVEIPADGGRPAVTISRNPLEEHDFLMQWLWLIGNQDSAISFVDGIIFGVGGDYDGVQLTDATGKTNAQGRSFLLARDGLRVATEAEVFRAREGATPGSAVELTPPIQLEPATDRLAMPYKINEYGIETWDAGNSSSTYDYSLDSNNLWYVVLEQE